MKAIISDQEGCISMPIFCLLLFQRVRTSHIETHRASSGGYDHMKSFLSADMFGLSGKDAGVKGRDMCFQ